jgi:hypothetical protein
MNDFLPDAFKLLDKAKDAVATAKHDLEGSFLSSYHGTASSVFILISAWSCV